MVHNYMPLNNQTIKPQYPIYCIEKVINTIIWPKHYCYFIINASNKYWAVYMKPKNKYKTGFITLYSQYGYF